MTVTINGATGIAGVNGSAALPAVQGDDTNTGVFYPAADTVAISTGGVEQMRINSSGQAEFTAGTAALPAITATGDTNTGMFFPAADTIAFTEGGAEAMRIDSSGYVGIGTTSPIQPLTVESTSNVRLVVRNSTETVAYSTSVDFVTGSGTLTSSNVVGRVGSTITQADPSTLQGTLIFSTNSGDSLSEQMRIASTGVITITNLSGTGSRAVNASATGVLSAASDSRLKQEVTTVTIPGLAEVMQLEPKAYKWLDDIEKRGDEAAVEIGFFANDVKDIIPSAAPMGNDGYYGFYDRAVTASLVKAIQEQQAMITALTARITALEVTP